MEYRTVRWILLIPPQNADPTLSEDRVYRYLDDSQQQSIFSAALVQLAVFVCVLTWKSLSFSRSKRNQA